MTLLPQPPPQVRCQCQRQNSTSEPTKVGYIRLVSLCPSLRCVWCQTTVHDDCMDSLQDADQCDLGEFRSLIIPPHYLYRVNKLRRRHPDEYSKVPRASRGYLERLCVFCGAPQLRCPMCLCFFL